MFSDFMLTWWPFHFSPSENTNHVNQSIWLNSLTLPNTLHVFVYYSLLLLPLQFWWWRLWWRWRGWGIGWPGKRWRCEFATYLFFLVSKVLTLKVNSKCHCIWTDLKCFSNLLWSVIFIWCFLFHYSQSITVCHLFNVQQFHKFKLNL
jgi:hypothetical protein